jgi:hypothetical protein
MAGNKTFNSTLDLPFSALSAADKDPVECSDSFLSLVVAAYSGAPQAAVQVSTAADCPAKLSPANNYARKRKPLCLTTL